MLPSMPLISTPYKDDSRSSSSCGLGDTGEGKGQDDDDGDKSVPGDRTPGPTESCPVPACPKRTSPLKHVTPILKKYSSQRKVRGSKSAAGSPDQVVEKPGLRPIAPKPVVVMITSQPLAQDRCEVPVTLCSAELPAAVDTSSSPAAATEHARNNEAGVVTEEKKKTEEVSKKEIVKDNEEDIAALMHSATTVSASPRARPAMSRKKTKQLKDMEATLNVLTEVEDAAAKEEKASSFAHSYFMKVKERLEGREYAVYQQFVQTMNEFGQLEFSVAELYQRVTDLLGHHGDLASEFLAFLLPDQALQCGKFMEHLMITKMRDFFRILEGFFAKQPQHMKKIYSSLSVLSNQTNVTIADVQSTILPLLKGNTFLTHSFLELLPQECPPDSLMTEFEFVQCYDDSESEEELFEVVEVPDHPDPYGGNNCCCPCHDSTNEKYRTRVLHCIPCGTRFIHGRVFVETGKGLRHAKIIFSGSDGKANIERLAAAKVLQRKGRKRRRTCGHIKKNRSPSKQALAANKANVIDDSSTENANTQTASKILSPASARSKTRTTNVSQKAREASTTIVAMSGNTPAAPLAEKKESRNSPSKLGRQVATVRLCRVPSTVCSYTIVPSLKHTTRTSVSLSETRNKATIKTSHETQSPSTTSSLATNVSSPVTVRRQNADQHKQQNQRQRKSVDNSVDKVPNLDTNKSRGLDYNLGAKKNGTTASDMEPTFGTRKKRGANETDEGSQNQDCAHISKVPKHFHGQVAAQKVVGQSDELIVTADKEDVSSADSQLECSVEVCETEGASVEMNTKSSRKSTKETKQNQPNGLSNCDETKSDSTELLVGTTDYEEKHEEDVMCVEEVAGRIVSVGLNYCVEKQTRVVENKMRHEEDTNTETENDVFVAKDAPRGGEGTETCENVVDVEMSDCQISEKDLKNNPEPIEFSKITEMYVYDENLKLSKKPEIMECDCNSEKDDDIIVEHKDVVHVDKCEDNKNLSDKDNCNNVAQNIQAVRLLMDQRNLYKSKTTEVVEMEEEDECEEKAVTDIVLDGKCMHEDDTQNSGMGKMVGINNDHSTSQKVVEIIVNEKLEEINISDSEESEEINVSDRSTEAICDENEIDTRYKCVDTREKYEVMENNKEQLCDEEVALNISNEYKCDEEDVIEIETGHEETATDVCDDEKIGCAAQSYEVVEVIGINSNPKDDDEVSVQGSTDNCKREDELEDKHAIEIVECDVDEVPVDGNDDTSRYKNVVGKLEEEVILKTEDGHNDEDDIKPLPWTRDEDKVILETFQVCSSVDHAFVSISEQLPSRTIKEIRTRFQTLMNLLQQLTGSSVSKGASSSST